ncbi:MAG: hypothetical protein HWN80_04795 [Candidatus Lokiarchaeota archaeon]|nr:hypothetical protein [Candidatus Lokiarchaeota archaeon]
MAKENNQYIIIQKKRKSNKIFLIFLGILGFVAIFVPFFGSNLRYMTGNTFKLIFNYLGNFCMILGGALLVINVLRVIGGKIYVKGFTVSILFLWIGAFLTGVPFEIMGFLIGGNQPIQGYHFF